MNDPITLDTLATLAPFTAEQDYPEHDYNSIPGPCRMDWCIRDQYGEPVLLLLDQGTPADTERLATQIANALNASC